MFIDEEQQAHTESRIKTLALAASCVWLQLVLSRQNRVLASADVLAACCSTSAWTRQAALLKEAVDRHFALEGVVLGAAIETMGLRAHAVIADASRRRIRHDLESLDALSWREGSALADRIRWELASHFREEESCSYRPLVRQQTDDAHAALTRRCEAVLAGAFR